jgi:hypothetical protein
MRAPGMLFLASVAAGIIASVGVVACVDEVHDQEVAALGPDTGPNGPTHRPGQPCLVCHGGEGPAKEQFSVAGTVYEDQGGGDAAVGAVVTVEDVTGRTLSPTTNAAGNFFITNSDWAPSYPTSMTVTSSDGTVQDVMLSHVSRDGSCASCHTLTAGPTSPGPVYLNAAPVQGD